MTLLLVAAVALNAFVVFAFSGPELGSFNLVLYSIIAPQLVGAALILFGVRRAGAYVVLFGSLLMVPIGLLPAFAARRILDGFDEAEFEQALERA